ncbi:hypothetical protein GCM10027447_32900 [Glycomyces halotolerans]
MLGCSVLGSWPAPDFEHTRLAVLLERRNPWVRHSGVKAIVIGR